jgi:hypothetical protein
MPYYASEVLEAGLGLIHFCVSIMEQAIKLLWLKSTPYLGHELTDSSVKICHPSLHSASVPFTLSLSLSCNHLGLQEGQD